MNKQDLGQIFMDLDTPWPLHMGTTPEGRIYLQYRFQAPDNDDEDNIDYEAHCRKWMLSQHMTKQEVVRTAWLAYKQAVSHEADEQFKYKGVAIYGPHIDVEELVNIGNRRETRDD